MKPQHRIAIALGVAQVAILASAARRHPHADGVTDRDCGPRGHGRHGRHRGPHHQGPGTRPDGPGFRGRPDGPPPWMRERLDAWHRAQHDTDLARSTTDEGGAEEA